MGIPTSAEMSTIDINDIPLGSVTDTQSNFTFPRTRKIHRGAAGEGYLPNVIPLLYSIFSV